MKIKRYKKVNKRLSFYVNNFSFRQPYQLLIDGTFCYNALNNQINIEDNMPRYLQGELRCFTTPCAIIEMENLGAKLGGALILLKKFTVHKCGHEGKPIPASRCIKSMIGKQNENHYIIATQDRDLQEKVRKSVGVPLLYFHSKAPVLEQPSEASLKFVKQKLSGISVLERKTIEELKEKSGIVEEVKPQRKKIKGPNPLSCLRKKKKPQNTGKIAKKDESVEKKKRKKVRIPKHVKEVLLKSV